MKLIIDIPEKVVTAIQNGEDYRYDIHTSIAQGIPCEEKPQGDLINRDLAISYTTSGLIRRIDGEDWIRISEVKQSLNDIPAVDAIPDEEGYEMYGKGYLQGYERGKKERPQGEWIDCKEFPYLANCSNCGYQMDTHEERGYFKFCPNCGADMRGNKK